MKRRDFILSTLTAVGLASCGGGTPSFARGAIMKVAGPSNHAGTWMVVHHSQTYMEQLANADSFARKCHDDLIEGGWTWDGMDGYSK